ncbi:MAG TPA: hypothetical protein VHT68_09785 [Pseudolabrys sp.]|jgi:hypothetical protein|nr:hypothetical protein [Pseudolabrys sp.]
MQAMQVLASSSVAAAAGSMIWLSFAVSPPITLVPGQSAAVDANGNVSSWKKQTVETVGAAVADTFEHRWHDIPAVPHPQSLDGPIDDLSTLPLAQDAPKLAQVELPDLAVAPQSEQENPVMVLPNPRARPSDVCARYGLYRVDYTRDHHRYWRCLHRRGPPPSHAAKADSPAASPPLLSRILSGASLIFQPASP